MKKRRTESMETKITCDVGRAACGMSASSSTLAYEASAQSINAARRTPHVRLFVPQGDDGIQRRRPPRWPDSEEQPHDRAEDERNQDGEDIDRRIPVRNRGEPHRAQHAEQN